MPPVSPSQGLGTLNVALSGFAKDYSPADMVADRVAPRVAVDRQSFQYIIFDKARRQLEGTTKRAPGARPGQVRFSYSTDKYFCDSHAQEAEITRESEANSLLLGFSSKKRAAQQVMDRIQLDRERVVAAAYAGIGGSNSLALSGTSQWSDYSGASHPIKDVEAAKYHVRKIGVRANALILPPDVVRALVTHPDVVARFQYVVGGAINMQQLQDVFGMQIIDAGAIITDGLGADSFVWGQNAYVAYVQPVASQEDLSVVKTFVDTTQGLDGYEVQEYPDPYLSTKKDWVAGDMYYDVKTTAPEACFAFLNASTQYIG
jgi:hypothetical protein